MADDLIERLKVMHVDPIGCGLERRWLRNPDGPEAADEIDRLRAALAVAEADANECSLALVEQDEKVCELTDALATAEARAEKAERERDAALEALHRINDLAGAYPEDAFTPLTDDEVATIASAMSAAVSNGSDRMHASWGRHLMSRTGEIARAALPPAHTEKED